MMESCQHYFQMWELRSGIKENLQEGTSNIWAKPKTIWNRLIWTGRSHMFGKEPCTKLFSFFLIRQYGLEEATRGKANFRSQGGRIKVLPRLNFWAAKTRSRRWKIEEQSKSRAWNKTFWQPWRPFNYISTWRSHKIIQFHLPSLLLMEALYN